MTESELLMQYMLDPDNETLTEAEARMELGLQTDDKTDA